MPNNFENPPKPGQGDAVPEGKPAKKKTFKPRQARMPKGLNPKGRFGGTKLMQVPGKGRSR